jgi:class 3 adenylate cyclase
VRKVVSILFCDLAGSTAMGDRTDPEALRALMNLYYDGARAVVEHHGGTVEKFVGDAVMAVFGIPVASEEDALRAVRSAVELRDVVNGLGLEGRIGVNTGEVVAGEGDTLVTGDAVNIASRLERSASAGEILLGDATLRLVRDAVDTEPLELTVKGKPEPVAAHRLLELDAAATGLARHLERPMVGRVRERDRLLADFADAAEARTCRMFTLIGPAGIGKSRLVADFLEQVGDTATVAASRALPYGEGITYWPLAEILDQLGLDQVEAIRSSPAETLLATRPMLERVAESRPLILVFDDLQWAEAPMLDLVDHIADWSKSVPIYLLCVARPELLDKRPGWGGGKLNATSILLEPLEAEDAAALATSVLGGVELAPALRERILATAEGNPLYLEEMAVLARDSDGPVNVPPTIHALLQARLDGLTERERTVVQRGAVEGKLFHRGGVVALAAETLREEIPGQLLSLVRKELVRPARALIPGDDAYRFRHLLIRDTAYEALPKAVRAELHERFADWLDTHGGMLEQDELVGYHLEQAARYRSELDGDEPAQTELAERAAARLGAAGRAAFEREDMHATHVLLERAIALLPDGPSRRRLLPDLVHALMETGENPGRAWELLEELEGGDARDAAIAAALRVTNSPIGPLAELTGRLDDAQRVLEDAGDLLGVARCENARGWVYWSAARAGDAHRAYRRAHDALRRAGSTALQRTVINGVMIGAIFSGTPADDIRRLLDEFEDEAVEAGPLLAATMRAFRARVEFGTGTGDLAALQAATDHEVKLLEQTGASAAAEVAQNYVRSLVPWLEGDAPGVERGARTRLEWTERLGLHIYEANALGEWAAALCDLGEADAALEAVARGREVASPDDVADQIILDASEAHALALHGDQKAAFALIAQARRTAENIDMIFTTDQVDEVEAKIRQLASDISGARSILTGLVERAEQRGFHRWADRYRRDLSALDDRR